MAMDYTKGITIDDMDGEAIDKKFEMLSADEVKMMARNFGAPDALYDLMAEIKRDDFYWAEFIYNGVKYWFYNEFIFSEEEIKPTGRWLLRSEENGVRKDIPLSTKEEFLAAPVFDSKTIGEIADEIPDYELSREPMVMFD